MTKMKPDPVEDIPRDLRDALAAVPAIEAAWKGLTPIGRRDFVSWIETAKQEETRKRRIAIACDKLASGKRRPCCYAVVPMDLYRALGENPAAKAKWSDLSADEKRDFSDWVEASPDKVARKSRVEESCAMLLAGRRGPN
jgi:uncharacterized protein YdeI (YjbR/CyaY-like superfamily)